MKFRFFIVVLLLVFVFYKHILHYLNQIMGGLSFGYIIVGIFIFLLLGFAVSFAFYGKKIFHSEKGDIKTKKEKTHTKKSIRDYLAETTFTFDPEDDNLLISKGNPKLMIRVIPGEDKDSITFGYNYPHKLERIDMYFKDAIPECEKIFTNLSTHKIAFRKGPGAKWEHLGQKLVELIFKLYEEKIPLK